MKTIAAFASSVLLASVAGCSAAAPTSDDPAASSSDALRRDTGGALYVLSNETSNAVLVLDRARDGSLHLAASVPTGGAGSNDALGSQGAIALSRDGRALFAVNAGDHTVSAFRVRRDGGLALVDVVDSGGDRPVSVTEAWGLVYVLNAGARQNASGFAFDGERLRAIDGSARALSEDASVGAAEIAFDRDGDALVVTEKATNRIDVLTLRGDGTPSAAHVGASAGDTPFGFAIDARGTIVVSDAFGGAAGAGAASSYRLHHDALLDVASGPVAGGQGAPCWVAIDGRFAFVANTGSGTVSTYAIARDGSIALVAAAGGVTGEGSAPADEAIAGGTLFVRDGGTASLAAFRIGADGSLTSAGGYGPLPPHAYGLAAR